jgi:Acetyltransferases, including N-acetylases of ribosomal proteins
MFEIEEISLSAWPSLQTELYDGWALRFAQGYSKRSNSVNALYGGRLGLDEKIAACERAYASRGLPAVFKILGCPEQSALDAALCDRGYERLDETAVRVLELGAAGDLGPENAASTACLSVELGDSFGDEWISACCAANGVEKSEPVIRKILENIGCEKIVAAKRESGKIVGCGYGAVDRRWVGVFDIVVAAERRRHGFGREIVASILDRAARLGARRAYLQVVSGNASAERLYDRLGFSEAYRYWYRKKTRG